MGRGLCVLCPGSSGTLDSRDEADAATDVATGGSVVGDG